jgi:hypothetical protein
MFRRAGALAAIAILPAAQVLAADSAGPGESAWKLSGYYKNILQRSDTVFPVQEPYTLDLNRLRLELKGKPAELITIDVQYDNEVLLGSYLRTAQFQIQKEQKPDQYWKGQSVYVDHSSYYGRQRIYRGTATATAGDTDVRFGRQRITWGTGRFWSPLDLLNPYSPTQLEREERVGVDALLVEQKLGPLSRVSAVYAPSHDSGNASTAVRGHANYSGVDLSAVGGKFRRDHVYGIDLAGQVGTAGVCGELMHARPETGSAYERAVVGADYAFANTLTLSAELYYNGAGASEKRDYDFSALFAGRIQNVGRRYVGVYAGYELTPLLKSNNYLVSNLGDSSWYFSPSLVYSIRTNVDLAGGVQFFRGAGDSEYGRFNDLYYVQAQWFF